MRKGTILLRVAGMAVLALGAVGCASGSVSSVTLPGVSSVPAAPVTAALGTSTTANPATALPTAATTTTTPTTTVPLPTVPLPTVPLPTVPLTTAAPPTAKAAHAGVGSTMAVTDGNGGKMNVTLLGVIDPASGADQYTTPDAGKRFVGVKIVLTNTGKAAVTGDVNIEGSVIGSDDQTYTADYNDIAGCTNFNDGSYSLAPAEKGTGCIVFQLPTGIKVSKFEYDMSGGFGDGTTAEFVG